MKRIGESEDVALTLLSVRLIYIEVRKQVADAPQVRSALYSKRKLPLRGYTKARWKRQVM